MGEKAEAAANAVQQLAARERDIALRERELGGWC